jgi:hypothetical protein
LQRQQAQGVGPENLVADAIIETAVLPQERLTLSI